MITLLILLMFLGIGAIILAATLLSGGMIGLLMFGDIAGAVLFIWLIYKLITKIKNRKSKNNKEK